MNLEGIMLSEISLSYTHPKQILYDSTYIRYLEWLNLYRQKAEFWLPGAGGGKRNGKLLFDRYRVSGCDDEKVLEMDSGDSCIAPCIYLMPLNCST